MLQEAIEHLVDLGKETERADAIMHGNRNKNRYFLHGGVVEVPHDVPARNHAVGNLESFAKCLTDETNTVMPTATVWHYGNEVIGVMFDTNDNHRDDKVTWPLQQSEKFTVLTKGAQQPRDHAEFVRFIVQNLRDEFDASAPGLLATIRSLKMKSGDTQEGDIQQGRESMGRAIQQEIVGATDLPETVIIKVKRWADLDYLADVECLLVLDVQARKLSLKPLADELTEAENHAQDWLHDELAAATEAPIFYGIPTSGL